VALGKVRYPFLFLEVLYIGSCRSFALPADLVKRKTSWCFHDGRTPLLRRSTLADLQLRRCSSRRGSAGLTGPHGDGAFNN
jgi:hypothetical protein